MTLVANINNKKVHPPTFYAFSTHPLGSRHYAPTLSRLRLGCHFSLNTSTALC